MDLYLYTQEPYEHEIKKIIPLIEHQLKYLGISLT